MLLTSPRQARRLPRRWGSDRGDVVSSVLLLPAVFLSVLLVFHVGLVMYGRNVARAAAQDALRATQLETATEGNGRQAAERTFELANEHIDSIAISVTKTDIEVVVNVKGEINTPLDGFFNDFDITVAGPTERFYAEDERE